MGGFANVLRAMERAGVTHLVYPSSHLVYGAHADTPVPVPEGTPARPNFQIPYAEHKAETEAVLQAWLGAHPAVTATVLRPAPGLDSHRRSFLARPYEGRVLWGVRGYDPPLQFLHGEDFAAALAHFAAGRTPGAYNVAADGGVERGDVARILGLRPRLLSEDAAYVGADVAAKVGLLPVPPGMVNTLLYPVVMDTAAAASAGWRPRFTNVATLEDFRPSYRS